MVQHGLGLEKGFLGSANKQEAIKWYKMAAEIQYELGLAESYDSDSMNCN
jgi:TPR repeat protein